MTIFDDLSAEQERLARILSGLTDEQWLSESGAAGWTVADVVLHLAQSEEGVINSTAGGAGLTSGPAVFGAAGVAGTVSAADGAPDAGGAGSAGGAPDADGAGSAGGADVDGWAAAMVSEQRSSPPVVFERWRRARAGALAALRAAPPDQSLQWVVTAMKPATLATTRLAEHWAHGLDITEPLGIDFPDTDRLRHIAWLAVRTLPYALARSGVAAGPVRVSLTAPSGSSEWRFGPDDADSVISGPAGVFCRVAAQRLAPSSSGLVATGPSATTALNVIRTYA
jgi:uncharacterized protein (TIGR03084 family)